MSQLCPSCQRSLYDRSLTHCGYCGAVIPESLRFTAAEIADHDRRMTEMDEQRKERERDAEIASITDGVESDIDLSSVL